MTHKKTPAATAVTTSALDSAILASRHDICKIDRGMSSIITRDYQGQAIAYQGDGWFNATQAAAKFGKIPYEWQRLPETAAYVAALERKYGKIPYSKSKRGANGGTWLHPKLAVRFAQWLDVDFAVWCDEQIDALLRGKDDWTRERVRLAAAHSVMSGMLHDKRAEAGKATEAHHYANEARLVNWALCGEFKGLDRDSLSAEDLALLAQLETRNAVLIGRGLDYDQRKHELSRHALALRPAQPAINGEAAA